MKTFMKNTKLRKELVRICVISLFFSLWIDAFPIHRVLAEDTKMVSTLAGTALTAGSADGIGINASFNHPNDMTIDSEDYLYVVDSSNCTIRKIDRTSGAVTTIAGSAGRCEHRDGRGADARFRSPYGITIDREGNLYVTDVKSSVIRKIDTNLNVTTIAGYPNRAGNQDGQGTDARFWLPMGITIDDKDNLYVADAGTESIRKIDRSLRVTTFAGSTKGAYGDVDAQGTDARFHLPSDLAMDTEGNLYVADIGNLKIRKIDSANRVTTIAKLRESARITIDSSNTLYISYALKHQILKMDLALDASQDNYGIALEIAGSAQGTSGYADGESDHARFHQPTGMVVDSKGNLYIADKSNHVIRKLPLSPSDRTTEENRIPDTNSDFPDKTKLVDNANYTYTVSTIAGTALTAGSVDGLGTSASFNHPYDMTFDSQDHLYVVDSSNCTIRKIDGISGVVTTIAGTAGRCEHRDGQRAAAGFKSPNGITIDKQGNLYVTEGESSVIRKIDTNLNVTTIAGYPHQAGQRDGRGSLARFQRPMGITIDDYGNLYVTDEVAENIRKIDTLYNVTTIAGSTISESGYVDAQGTNAKFHIPSDITIDSYGNLYVADLANMKIRKIDPAHHVTSIADLDGFWMLSMDKYDELYIADVDKHKILKMDHVFDAHMDDYGVASEIAGSPEGYYDYADGESVRARFNKPSGIAIDSRGNVYVADYNNHVIRKLTYTYFSDKNSDHPDETNPDDSDSDRDTNSDQPDESNPDDSDRDTNSDQPDESNPDGSDRDTNSGHLDESNPDDSDRDTNSGHLDESNPDDSDRDLNKVTTIAGTPLTAGSKDGIGTKATFNRPNAMTIDSQNHLYVVDSYNCTIRKIDGISGEVNTIAGTAGRCEHRDGQGAEAGFDSPYGITIDSEGNLYVAEEQSRVIRKIDRAGRVTTIAGVPYEAGNQDGQGTDARFWLPMGITIDDQDNLYVTDAGTQSIRKIDRSYHVTTIAGSTEGEAGYVDAQGTAARFHSPTDISIDSKGNLYVVEFGNTVIRKINRSYHVKTVSWLNGLSTITIDSRDNIYVADTNNHSIYKTVSHTLLNNRYEKKIKISGTKFGPYGTSGYKDGDLEYASFNEPSGMTVDSRGNLYIADKMNHVIRKLTLPYSDRTNEIDSDDADEDHSDEPNPDSSDHA